MTFSIVGRCERTGMVGVAITTSSICVGARCPHVRAGVGAVATQNITDPRLGAEILDRLGAGAGAEEALAETVRAHENISYRQLTVVDASGNRAHFTGEHILGTNCVALDKNCIAAGNLLASKDVPRAMTEAFAGLATAHLAERLLAGLAGGIAAGGEEGPVRSAALLVADRHDFALVDLRIDWSQNAPVDELRALWRRYEPEMADYVTRAVAPSQAPSYGVAGDP